MKVAASVKVSLAMNAMILAVWTLSKAVLCQCSVHEVRSPFGRTSGSLTKIPDMPVPPIDLVGEYDNYRGGDCEYLSLISDRYRYLDWNEPATHKRQNTHNIINPNPLFDHDPGIESSSEGYQDNDAENDVYYHYCRTMCRRVLVVGDGPLH